LEQTPANVHTLGTMAAMAYGVAAQRLDRVADAYADQKLILKQLDRPIWVTTSKGENGGCKALVRTRIGAVEFAELMSIYVKLGGLFSVDYVDVKGRNPATGEIFVERIKH